MLSAQITPTLPVCHSDTCTSSASRCSQLKLCCDVSCNSTVDRRGGQQLSFVTQTRVGAPGILGCVQQILHWGKCPPRQSHLLWPHMLFILRALKIPFDLNNKYYVLYKQFKKLSSGYWLSTISSGRASPCPLSSLCPAPGHSVNC